MTDYLISRFFINYFLIESLYSKFYASSKMDQVFEFLADAFKIPQDNRLMIKRNLDSPNLKNVDSLENYYQVQRYLSYNRIGKFYSPIELEYINWKSEALIILEELKFTHQILSNQYLINSHLESLVQRGLVVAHLIMGIINTSGLNDHSIIETGLKSLTLGLKWNNLDCAFILCLVDPIQKSRYINYIYSISIETQNQELINDLTTIFDQDQFQFIPQVSLIANYFKVRRISSKLSDQYIINIIDSLVLSNSDKQYLLNYADKEIIKRVNNLPLMVYHHHKYLKLSLTNPLLHFNRSNEINQINQILTCRNLGEITKRKPLLIYGRDNYLIKSYLKSLNVDTIWLEANQLLIDEILRKSNNIFINKIRQDNNPRLVFIINNYQSLNNDNRNIMISDAHHFLQNDLSLTDLGITVDYSGVDFIFITNNLENINQDHFTLITLNEVTKNEKIQLINQQLINTKDLQKVQLSLTDLAINQLICYHCDYIINLISNLITYYNQQPDLLSIQIDYTDLRNFGVKENPQIGFGFRNQGYSLKEGYYGTNN